MEISLSWSFLILSILQFSTFSDSLCTVFYSLLTSPDISSVEAECMTGSHDRPARGTHPCALWCVSRRLSFLAFIKGAGGSLWGFNTLARCNLHPLREFPLRGAGKWTPLRPTLVFHTSPMLRGAKDGTVTVCIPLRDDVSVAAEYPKAKSGEFPPKSFRQVRPETLRV